MSKKTSRKSEWSRFARADGSFDFDALTDAQKEKFYEECEAIGAEGGAPLSIAQVRFRAAGQGAGAFSLGSLFPRPARRAGTGWRRVNIFNARMEAFPNRRY
jgi:hypothetical protein